MAATQLQPGNPQEREYPPLEAVTRRHIAFRGEL
jgi:hypothetical protein